MTPTELKEAMDAGEPMVLVDVREHFEREISDLPEVGQLRIPMGDLVNQTHRLPQDEKVVFYCRSGSRSANVAMYLQAQGWENVVNLQGGVLGWREEVDPSIAAY